MSIINKDPCFDVFEKIQKLKTSMWEDDHIIMLSIKHLNN